MEKSKTLRCFFPQLLGKAKRSNVLGFSTVTTGAAVILSTRKSGTRRGGLAMRA
jgi:hypothetical protein